MKRDDDDTLALLLQKLRWLRLPGMAQLVPHLLESASKDNLTAPTEASSCTFKRGTGKAKNRPRATGWVPGNRCSR